MKKQNLVCGLLCCLLEITSSGVFKVLSSYQASTVSVSIPWFLSNTFLNFVICERKQLHKINKKILWNCGFEIWELLSSDLKKICSQQTIGIKFENNRTIESFEIKLNTLSRSVCQLGRKQEHFRSSEN